jgi:hypothetical protein
MAASTTSSSKQRGLRHDDWRYVKVSPGQILLFCAKPFSILGADARLLSHTPTFRRDCEHTTHYLESCLETS